MPRKSCADDLARACVQAQAELRRAGRALHDEIGSLLAVAALRQLAKRHSEARRRQVTLRSTMSAVLPLEVAEVIYQAASHAVLAAAGRVDVTRIRITAAGARSVTVRVAD